MSISPLFFTVFAAVALTCSLMVVFKKNPVASAFSLIVVFFAFAGIYALLDAHLVAALQILVYAGAIMVLFVFVIMLLNADTPSFDLARSSAAIRAGAVIITALLVVLFVWVFKEGGAGPGLGTHTAEEIRAGGGNTKVMSRLLFSEYILPFELTSILLLTGIVGAVAMAKRKLGEKK